MLTKFFSPFAGALLVLLASCSKQSYSVVPPDVIENDFMDNMDNTDAPSIIVPADPSADPIDNADASTTPEQYLCQAMLLEPVKADPEEIRVDVDVSCDQIPLVDSL
ncbi:MAG: hypothetical protein AAFV72_19805 [Cyanobacteria bacterium J06635_1]